MKLIVVPSLLRDWRQDRCENPIRDSKGRYAGCASGGGGGGGVSGSGGEAITDFSDSALRSKKVKELEAIAKEVGASTPTKYKNRKSSWIDEIQKVKGSNKKPGRYTEKDLRSKKVKELEAIAKEVGASTPTKYKNRKSSWIDEIQKAQGGEITPKPIVKPRPGRFSPDELRGKKLAELKAIAKETGAGVPTKYANRKSSWINEIEKAQGREITPKPAKKPAKPSIYRTLKLDDPEELKKSGESFFNAIAGDLSKPGKREAELLAIKKDAAIKLQKAQKQGDAAQVRRQLTRFTQVEGEYQRLSKTRKKADSERFDKLREELRKQSAITREQAENIANNIKIDPSVPNSRVPQLRRDMADFMELTGGRGSSTLERLTKTDDRAYASRGDKSINVGTKADEATSRTVMFHEMGHHLEFSNPKILDAAISWRDRKATSDQPQKLSQITKDKFYGDELAYPDAYISPYVGKTYNRFYESGGKLVPSDKERVTEVVAMGTQYFDSGANMRTLREKDPDHFNLIMGMLVNNDEV